MAEKFKRIASLMAESIASRRKKGEKNRPVEHYSNPKEDIPEMEKESLEDRAKRYEAEKAKKEKPKPVKKKKKVEAKAKKKKKKKASMEDFFESRDELDIPLD